MPVNPELASSIGKKLTYIGLAAMPADLVAWQFRSFGDRENLDGVGYTLLGDLPFVAAALNLTYSAKLRTVPRILSETLSILEAGASLVGNALMRTGNPDLTVPGFVIGGSTLLVEFIHATMLDNNANSQNPTPQSQTD